MIKKKPNNRERPNEREEGEGRREGHGDGKRERGRQERKCELIQLNKRKVNDPV